MPGHPRIRLVEVPSLLWALVESDFLTFVLPNTAFGLLAALAAPLLTECVWRPTIWSLLIRGTPRILLFNAGNLLVFDLANQRLPESVHEDSLNKPWRPLPRGCISPMQVKWLLLGAVPAVLAVSSTLGVGVESGLILLLTWMYNDLRGGDELTRDPIIAIAYDLFLVSSLRIAITSTVCATTSISSTGYRWLGMIGGMILTTMQIQDLRDQVGDRARGRKTWPLVLGDGISRWWISICVQFWSIAFISFWKTPMWISVMPISLGIWIACCILLRMGDVRAWRWWCVWQAVLYALPALSILCS